jgi:hypothetical protein
MLDVEKDRNPTTGQDFIPTITDVRAFAKEFARLTHGHTLILYAPGWYWTGHIGNPSAADLGPLCASRSVPVRHDATGHPIAMTPAEAFAKVGPTSWTASHGGWSRATILQFTSTGKVAGCGGPVDVDAYNGTLQKLRALTGPAGHAPAALAAATPAAPLHAPAAPHPPAASPGNASVAVITPAPKRFHVVVAGETLSGIAARHGFVSTSKMPAFRVMLNRFPENVPFRVHPELIHPGDRVRVS